MNVILKFDIESYVVYIPDGYVHDVRSLQEDFFDWLQNQQVYCLSPGRPISICYNADTFLQYLNEVVLFDSRERAYFVDQRNKKMPTIIF